MNVTKFGIVAVMLSFSFPVISAGTGDLSAQLIDDIQYGVNPKGQAEIEIRFAVPIQFRSRVLKDRASRADARFKFHLTDVQKHRLPLEEVRMAEKHNDIPLRSVSYDGFNVNDPLISVQFKRMVAFRMEQGGNDSIKITLPEVKPKGEPMNLISPEEAARIQAMLVKRKNQPIAVATASTNPSRPASVAKPVPKKMTKVSEQRRVKTPTPQPAPKRQSSRETLVQRTQKRSTLRLPPVGAGGRKANDRAMEVLMAQGRAALTRGDNLAAIKLFTRVLNAKNHSLHADSQELLALARERNDQRAHAKRLYQHYLKVYPKGAGHERVKQRLAELSAPAVVPAGSLKRTKVLASTGFRKDMFGSLSVYGFQGALKTDQKNAATNEISSVQSYLNMSGRFRSPRFDIRTVAYGTVTQRNDLDKDDETNPTTFEANRLYFELKDSRIKYNMRLGRQSGNSGGIFGRFDGLQMGYDFTTKTRASVSMGYTVDFTEKDRIQTNMPFVSANLGFGSYFKYLDFTPYFFTQAIDGINNRNSTGLEVRWGHPKMNIFATVDYEPVYQAMNLIMLNTLWRVSSATTLNMNIDDRKSPLLQTRNALNNTSQLSSKCGVQQIFTEIADYLRTCDEQLIRDSALDNTGSSQFITLALNHSFNTKFQVNMDISQIKTTLSNLIPIDPNDPLSEFEKDTDDSDQLAYSMQWVFSQIVQNQDSHIIGLRLAEDTRYTGMQLSLSNRFAFSRALRFSTRLLADQRDFVDDENGNPGNTQTRLRPSLKLDYRWKRSFEVQFEARYEQTKNSQDTIPDSNNYLYTFGFRRNF